MTGTVILTSDFPSTENMAVAELLKRIPPARRIAWIPPGADSGRKHFPAARRAFRTLGVENLEMLSIDEYAAAACPIDLSPYDALYLSGGDPLAFRRAIVASGFSAHIESFLKAGGLVIGASGGAMQLAENISLYRLLSESLADVLAAMIYFAGPLFSEAELAFNASLAADLEDVGHEVFLPQRDGIEANKPPYSAMRPEARRRAVFELDRERILACDVFLIVLDGRVPDEGACVELGLAYGHRLSTGCERLIVGLHTDRRAAFLGSKLNPMLLGALDLVVEDCEHLLNALDSRLSPRRSAG